MVCLNGETDNHVILSPPYAIHQAYQAVEWIARATKQPTSRTHAALSYTSALRNVSKIRQNLKRLLGNDVNTVLFISPFIAHSGFLSNSLREVLAELREQAVNVRLAACVSNAAFSQTVGKILALRNEMWHLENVDIVCMKNNLKSIRDLFAELNAMNLFRRSTQFEVSLTEDLKCSLQGRPISRNVNCSNLAFVCKCHQKPLAGCFSLKSNDCIRSIDKYVLISGRPCSLLESSLMSTNQIGSITSAAAVAVISKSLVNPAFINGEGIILTPKPGTSQLEDGEVEPNEALWRKLLMRLQEANQMLIIRFQRPLFENDLPPSLMQDLFTDLNVPQIFAVMPICPIDAKVNPRSRGPKATPYFAIMKKVACFEEIKCLPLNLQAICPEDLGEDAPEFEMFNNISVMQWKDCTMLASSAHESVVSMVQKDFQRPARAGITTSSQRKKRFRLLTEKQFSRQ
uniref:Uncharacterized protein n=1 Tax=Spongospora subterranea TaxID=70186 RepID=A0A0H5R9X6_9EUKA|eukprot:CRZ10482.1 hypothetical protein [Spongospora subterranea]